MIKPCPCPGAHESCAFLHKILNDPSDYCVHPYHEAWTDRPTDGVVDFIKALRIAQETGADIKMTPLMWEAVEKIRSTIGGNRG